MSRPKLEVRRERYAAIAEQSTGLGVGDHVEVRDVFDKWHDRIVIGFGGWDFPCVLVATVDDWNEAQEDGFKPDEIAMRCTPWPAEDVRLIP